MAVVVRDVLIRVKVQMQGATGGFPGGGGVPGGGGGGVPGGGGRGGVGPRPGGVRPGDVNVFGPGGATPSPLVWFGPGGDPRVPLGNELRNTTRGLRALNRRIGEWGLELVRLVTWSRAITRVTFGIQGAGLAGATTLPLLGAGIGLAALGNLGDQGGTARRIRGRIGRGAARTFGLLRQEYGGSFYEEPDVAANTAAAQAFIRGIGDARERTRLAREFAQQSVLSQYAVGVQNRLNLAGGLSGLRGGSPLGAIEREISRLNTSQQATPFTTGGELTRATLNQSLNQARFDEIQRIAETSIRSEQEKLRLLQRQVELEREKANTIEASIRSGTLGFVGLSPGQRKQQAASLARFNLEGVPEGLAAQRRLIEASGLNPEAQERVAEALRRRFAGQREYEILVGNQARTAAQAESVKQAETAVGQQEKTVAGFLSKAEAELRRAADSLAAANIQLNTASTQVATEARDREAERAARNN